MSFVYYNSFIILCVMSYFFSEKSNSVHGRMFFHFTSFIIFFLFSALRFDVGPDYEEYVRYYYSLKEGEWITVSGYFSGLIIFSMVSRVFSAVNNGYIFVFASYSLITTIFIYAAVSRFKKHLKINGSLIIFVFISMGFYLDSLDRIRQWCAISIFFFGFIYIFKNDFLRYFLFIFIASCFHFSAILLLPLYFVLKVNVGRLLVLSSIVAIAAMQFLGWGEPLFRLVMSNVPYYSEVYSSNSYTSSFSTGSGAGVLLKILVIFSSILLIKESNNYKLRNVVYIGLFIYIVSSGNINISRFSDYLLVIVCVTIPYCINRFSIKDRKYVYVVAWCVLLIYYQSLTMRNNYNYKTVFSPEAQYQVFEERSAR